MKKVWYEVRVKSPQGIEATHYVEVEASLVHKEAWASRQEREAGFEVLWARPWLTENQGVK